MQGLILDNYKIITRNHMHLKHDSEWLNYMQSCNQHKPYVQLLSFSCIILILDGLFEGFCLNVLCVFCRPWLTCEDLTMFLLDSPQAFRQTVVYWTVIAACKGLKLVLHRFIVFLLSVERFCNISESLIETRNTNTTSRKPATPLIHICWRITHRLTDRTIEQ